MGLLDALFGDDDAEDKAEEERLKREEEEKKEKEAEAAAAKASRLGQRSGAGSTRGAATKATLG